uniref:Immunoglobulin domain-containing protein n=1 Tax=Sinocyclocheilus anshuiensis TaxID=1608454 RepID=A0A671SE31_9TELE
MLKILQLQLYLLTWCQVAEILTNQLTDLGQNVTMNCGLDLKEVTWLVLNLPDPPVLILRSFSNPPATFYFNNRFKQKYSVQPKHNLFINNVSIDELGVYYCTNIDRTAQFSNGTRLDQTTWIVLLGTTLCNLLCLMSYYIICEASQNVYFCIEMCHYINQVRWRNKYDLNVYEIIKGKVSVEGQDPQYKNRTESFPEEYMRGNFSIKLYNLQHTDAEEYTCYIIMEESEDHTINEGTKPRPEMIVMIISVLCIGIIFSLVVSSFTNHN